MNFTSTPPTVPGIYNWKQHKDSVYALPKQITWDSEGKLYDAWDSEQTVEQLGGIWCRLVPVEEVEKAFREGYEMAKTSKDFPGRQDSCFFISHAKQIVDGSKGKESGE